MIFDAVKAICLLSVVKKKKRARILSILAIAALGNGLMDLFAPGYLKAWRTGPGFFRDIMDFFLDRPLLTRVIGAVKASAGIWLGWKLRKA